MDGAVPQGQPGGGRPATASSSSRTAASTPAMRRSRACWPPPACTITWCARAPAPSAACWSRRATRARCTTSRCCMGYGAGAVNPYLAFESLHDLLRQGLLPGVTHDQAVLRYIKALNKGVLKVMSKMGISTLQSYCGAQIFEAVGLDRAFVDSYFTGTASRIGGVGLAAISEEVRRRHARAFGPRPAGPAELESGGEYQWRRDGEIHLFNPETVLKLQHATRTGQYDIFKQYTRLVDDQSQRRATLRGLFRFKPLGPAVPLDEVEPVEAILPRFSTGAMSYGSISQEAHETLAIAMNRMGAKSNTGEGGEDPARNVPRRQRRLAAQRHQAGGVGPLRRDQRVPGQRRRPADQDGAGRQAGRGRPAARPQGLSVDRQGAALDARRRPDLAAAAPRHLLDRGPGAADLRPEERQPAGPRAREAGRRVGRRHGRGRGVEGARRRGARSPATTAAPAPRRSPASSTPACRGSSAWPRRSRCCCATSCATASSCRSTAS